jgi:hypothetical protein
MSFMPIIGTAVRLKDRRIAAVSGSDEDTLVFAEGHEARTEARQISEMLAEEIVGHTDPLRALHLYLGKSGD